MNHTKASGPCVCGSDEDVGFMICCDGCDSWMHGPCVKITKTFSTGIDQYFCPRCKPLPTTTTVTATATTTTTAAAAVAKGTAAKGAVARSRKRPVAKAGVTTTAVSAESSGVLTATGKQLSGIGPGATGALTTPSATYVQTSKLLELSDEILLWILMFVRCQKSLCRVSSTCKRLWRVAQDSSLWKHITLHHDTTLRQHWDTLIRPRLLNSQIQELNLIGEISTPVTIDALNLHLFTSLRILRLEDIQTYTVYRLASKLPWLTVFEAHRIKGNSESWDWRPFMGLTNVQELVLWRNEKPSQTFSLSQDLALEEGADDVYPIVEGAATPGEQQHVWGGFVQSSASPSLGLESGSGSGSGSDMEDDDIASAHSHHSQTGGSESSSNSPFPGGGGGQGRKRLSEMMPNLQKLALVNIVSPTTHRGTDAIMRHLVSRVSTYLYWNSFNILFPVLRTSYSHLSHLTLIEPCEPAWREATWQDHASVFHTMHSLQSITLINANMSRRFLLPILDALLSLTHLRILRLVSTEDIETIHTVLTRVLETRWAGLLHVSVQDDLGSDPKTRDWQQRAMELVREANQEEERIRSGEMLQFSVKLFHTEWDEDAGLKRLCLKAWQQSL
ncbi:hypothetical protein BGZ50_003958 [Haplosporangium sp. Z 11]|nr:hypothetical protein BGZ50_003958 [Haplosporangium sp. Z 11]